MTRSWRWVVPALLLALLTSTPALLAARPVRTPTVEPAALLARIRASAPVGWSGYGESRGALALPDIQQLGDVSRLLGSVTRYRVWWHNAVRQRVDSLSLTGEKDTATDATGSWRWDSDVTLPLRVVGSPPVRLLEAGDLVAPTLGRRLAGTADVLLTALPARRLAGRSVPGLRLTPRHPAATTIASVDLWADPRTGLTLQVDVRARGQRVPVLRSLLLDLDSQQPSLTDANFQPRAEYATVTRDDLAGQVDQLSPFLLPGRLGGLPRTALIGGAVGVATFGAGFGQVLLLPLPRGYSRNLARSLRSLGGSFQTPLLNALLVQGQDHEQRFLLAGTVPAAVLTQLSTDLRLHPLPPRVSS